jgi:YVTN family beta-propeller protein
MGFRSLFSILTGFLISSGLLLGAGTTWEAVVGSWYSGHVIPIPIPNDTPETAVSCGADPTLLAITPDGSTAVVVDMYYGQVIGLDLTQSPIQSIFTVPIDGSPFWNGNIAITPDGSKALVPNGYSSMVNVLDLTQMPVVSTYTVSVGTSPEGVAVTPDGSKALVSNTLDNTVSVLDLTQTPVVCLYTVPVGVGPAGMAITPDGSKALIANNDATVSVLDLTTLPTASSYTVSVGTYPTNIAITADGSKALVTNNGDGTVSVLDLTQSPIVSGYTVPVGRNPGGIAITPDGARAYVSNSGDNTVSVLDVTQTPIKAIHNTIPLVYSPWGIAITPDQSPISLFTGSVSGLTVTFDGSGSSSPVGNVKEYIWNFGDGSDPVTTTSPKVSHSYARSGEYSVTLRVINDAGTSLDVTFTGQVVSNHGLPRAQSTQTITVDPLAPPSFTGKVHLDKHNQEVLLKTKWRPSADANTWRYEIFADNEKIAVIDANAGNHETIELHPHHFPSRISDKYRVFLDNKYAIRSVNTDGVASALTQLKVER